MNRSATASLHSATPKKNVPYFPDLAGVKFLLKKEREFFFRGSARKDIRAGGVQMQFGRGKVKLFLREKRICFASANSFLKQQCLDFHRAGGCGRNARRIFLDFGGLTEK